MKNIVKAVIDKYGTGKTRYGLIVFGSTASVKVGFSDYFPSKDGLKNLVETFPRSSGSPTLHNALAEAKNLFANSGRSNAKKVLIVMVDEKSSSTPKDVKKEARLIHEKNVLIIAVNVGEGADPSDMDGVVSRNDNIFAVDTNVEPTTIVNGITSVIDKGNILLHILLD